MDRACSLPLECRGDVVHAVRALAQHARSSVHAACEAIALVQKVEVHEVHEALRRAAEVRCPDACACLCHVCDDDAVRPHACTGPLVSMFLPHRSPVVALPRREAAGASDLLGDEGFLEQTLATAATPAAAAACPLGDPRRGDAAALRNTPASLPVRASTLGMLVDGLRRDCAADGLEIATVPFPACATVVGASVVAAGAAPSPGTAVRALRFIARADEGVFRQDMLAIDPASGWTGVLVDEDDGAGDTAAPRAVLVFPLPVPWPCHRKLRLASYRGFCSWRKMYGVRKPYLRATPAQARAVAAAVADCLHERPVVSTRLGKATAALVACAGQAPAKSSQRKHGREMYEVLRRNGSSVRDAVINGRHAGIYAAGSAARTLVHYLYLRTAPPAPHAAEARLDAVHFMRRSVAQPLFDAGSYRAAYMALTDALQLPS